MNAEIHELLIAAKYAIQERTQAKTAQTDKLRELDERVCLTTRTLYMRYKSTVFWCRTIDKQINAEVRHMLESALKDDCLPMRDYDDTQTEYAVRESVQRRIDDFDRDITPKMKEDPKDPTRYIVPLPAPAEFELA